MTFNSEIALSEGLANGRTAGANGRIIVANGRRETDPGEPRENHGANWRTAGANGRTIVGNG